MMFPFLRSTLTAICLLSIACTVDAAPRKPVLPQEDFAATVTVSEHSPASSHASRSTGKYSNLKRIRLTKQGEAMLYEMAWTNGKKTQAWIDLASGRRIEQMPSTGDVYISSRESSSLPVLAALDGGSISWVRPKDKTGMEKLKGKEYVHFQREMTFPEELVVTYQAWMDPETGTIVALDDSTARYDIVFDAKPPTGTLVMPEAFKAELERVNKKVSSPSHL